MSDGFCNAANQHRHKDGRNAESKADPFLAEFENGEANDEIRTHRNQKPAECEVRPADDARRTGNASIEFFEPRHVVERSTDDPEDGSQFG